MAQPGVVGRVFVSTGDAVKAGTPLVELQSEEARAELLLRKAALESANARLAELREGARVEELETAAKEVAAAEATFENAQASAERDRKLAEGGSIAVSQRQASEAEAKVAQARLEQARVKLGLLKRGARATQVASALADVTRARAELEKAQAQLSALSVTAPFDGVVVDLKLGIGEAAAAGTPVAVLADLENLVIKADVPEAQIPLVKVGAPAEGTVEALQGKVFKAQVSQVALEADRQKGTVEVTVRLLDKDERVRPKMSARVAIFPPEKE